MALLPRVVVVHRRSELDELIDRHGTRGQVEFFLRTRGRSLADLQARHDALGAALRCASAAIPTDWRRGWAEREDLPRFDFDLGDVVVVVGPDGLVANTAKYLEGQPVIGVDPEPGRGLGALARHPATAIGGMLGEVHRGRVTVEARTMVRASLDDGTTLDALNDIYVGQAGHQSARYELRRSDGKREAQSSSGLIVSTGTGATGWAASIVGERGRSQRLPSATSNELAWFVREAWPSPLTGTSLTSGALPMGDSLDILTQSDTLVTFGDGIEGDRLLARWGQLIHLEASPRRLHLVP